jgi:hypothetical protein
LRQNASFRLFGDAARLDISAGSGCRSVTADMQKKSVNYKFLMRERIVLWYLRDIDQSVDGTFDAKFIFPKGDGI